MSRPTRSASGFVLVEMLVAIVAVFVISALVAWAVGRWIDPIAGIVIAVTGQVAVVVLVAWAVRGLRQAHETAQAWADGARRQQLFTTTCSELARRLPDGAAWSTTRGLPDTLEPATREALEALAAKLKRLHDDRASRQKVRDARECLLRRRGGSWEYVLCTDKGDFVWESGACTLESFSA